MSSFNRKAMGDERTNSDFSFHEELQKRFHVAGFGPAHIADWIVAPFLLVGRVVAAGTIRTRGAEGEFLLVIRSAFDIESHHPHGHDNGAVACDGTGKIDVIVAG